MKRISILWWAMAVIACAMSIYYAATDVPIMWAGFAVLSTALALSGVVYHPLTLPRLIRYVPAAELFPRFYGLAWWSINRHGAYCAPIPLNVLICLLRGVWFRLKSGGIKVPVTPFDAYWQGRRDAALSKAQCSKESTTNGPQYL